MPFYALSHLSDANLKRDTHASMTREIVAAAVAIAHIAEFDARRLYVAAGYPSMHAYSVAEFGLTEDAAFTRITVARTARQFPELFDLLKNGRLNLTAVRTLAPHFTASNVGELCAAALGKSGSELDRMLAQRFTRAGSPELPFGATMSTAQEDIPQAVESTALQSPQLVPERVELPPPKPAPGLVIDKVMLRVAIERSTYEDLRYAQALLSHSIPSGDVAKVLGRALKELIFRLEKRKFGATTRKARAASARASRGRSIPARVRREVWHRDRGECTFTGEGGQRCGSRRFLEFDHVEPHARGGRATPENLRLRCRAHNQYEADRTFGAGFMKRKRDRVRPESPPVKPAAAPASPASPAAAAS